MCSTPLGCPVEPEDTPEETVDEGTKEAAIARIKHEVLIGPKRQTLSTVGGVRVFERMAQAEVYEALGRFGAGQVLLKPAREGKGTIAGGAVRAVVEAAGIQNVLTKSIGTKNPHNVIKATFDGLLQLREKAEIAEIRGIDPANL